MKNIEPTQNVSDEEKAFLKALARNIYVARRNQDYKAFNFAINAGFTPSHYYAIEKGKINITIFTLRKIAQALGVSIKDLLPDDINIG